MTTRNVYEEAKRFFRMGAAPLWLHSKSKRPLGNTWRPLEREPWGVLKKNFTKSLNVGVKLGTPSRLENGLYLAVVDIDVKGTDEKHRDAALNAARAIVGEKADLCPSVLSGRGNGSRHWYCVTSEPFKTETPARSSEILRVYMPSKDPSKKEREQLSEEELKEGIRLAPAWEVSLYSDGRQVVLPPSIHPDSKKPYHWERDFKNLDDLPLVEFELKGKSAPRESKGEKQTLTASPGNFKFRAVDVPLEFIEISESMRESIVKGTGVEDRSAFLIPACKALISADLSQDEILSVLTNRETFLGECAYEHARTDSRARAAYWVWKYTLVKVMEERRGENLFEEVAEITDIPMLADSDAANQEAEFAADRDWKDELERGERGRYRNTINNCKTILTNVCGTDAVVGRNEFAANDYYLVDTPWRSTKGSPVTDIDIVRIKFYCSEKFGVEFSDNTINQSLLDIADLNRYHPIRDWIRSLTWDGTPRINTWLKDYAGAFGPEPYLSDISRKVLVAMVKRVFEPGCKFDHVLILEGLQDMGKSTLLARLAGEWFSDAPLVIGDKDAVLTMQSKWLIELGELSSMGRAETETLKAFISQRVDRIRAPYGKRVEEFPRQSIFVGTTNQDEYLRDLTGNRRYWAVSLRKGFKVDFNAISEIRGQLFAEAFTYFEMEEPLYLENDKTRKQAQDEQGKRLQRDSWMDEVHEILNLPDFPREGFALRELADKMDKFGAHRLSLADSHRLGRCLIMLGVRKFQEPTGVRRKMWRITDDFVRTDEPCGTETNLEPRFHQNDNDFEKLQ